MSTHPPADSPTLPITRTADTSTTITVHPRPTCTPASLGWLGLLLVNLGRLLLTLAGQPMPPSQRWAGQADEGETWADSAIIVDEVDAENSTTPDTQPDSDYFTNRRKGRCP